MDLLAWYDSIIKDQLKKEIIEEVNDRTEEGCKKHYVPHHAVITPDRKQLKLELPMMHQQKPKKDARVLMSVCIVVLSS